MDATNIRKIPEKPSFFRVFFIHATVSQVFSRRMRENQRPLFAMRDKRNTYSVQINNNDKKDLKDSE